MKWLCFLLFCFSVSARLTAAEAWLESGFITPEIIEAVKEELDLTPDQERQMKELAQALLTVSTPLEQRLAVEQRELSALLTKSGSTQEQASEALESLLKTEAELKHHRLKNLLALRDLLSPEQQQTAFRLASRRNPSRNAGLPSQIREKVRQLRLAVEATGAPATEAMQIRSGEIEAKIRSKEFAAADQLLDRLVLDSGLESANQEAKTPLEFGSYEPGDTRLEALLARYHDVEQRAQKVLSLSLLHKLAQAHAALEKAKQEEDATAAGRILTWAEQMLPP